MLKLKLQNPITGSILKKWPQGNIYQGYAENFKMYNSRIGTWGHTGIDISGIGYFGRPIVSALNGIVSEVYYRADLGGQVISISGTDKDEEGNFLHTIYGHLIKDSQKVKKGDIVKAGQKIGMCGNSGFVISGNTKFFGNAPGNKGTHLHFGVYECNKDGSIKNLNNGFKGCVDPMPYLTGNIKDTIPAYQSILTTMATILRDLLSKGIKKI